MQINVNEALPTRLMEIVAEVNSKLDTIQQESVSVGTLLIEAKEEMQEQGQKYADFVAFCRDEFNIGKAQASKLMKVATVFKDDTRFTGVAMRVLYALAVDATPEEMDKAADFAASGTLSSAVVNQLLHPVPVKQEEPKAPQESDSEALDSELHAALSLANVPEREERHGLSKDDDEIQEETSQLSEEIAELRGALQAANELIKTLQTEKVTRTKASNAPTLPQFKSKCSYAVLGLSKEQASKASAIKKAFREIIKCGYGDGHEAFDLLTSAKDVLLKEAV